MKKVMLKRSNNIKKKCVCGFFKENYDRFGKLFLIQIFDNIQ